MNIKQISQLNEARNIIEEVVYQEEEKIANMENRFSETERFQKMDETKDELEDILQQLDALLNQI